MTVEDAAAKLERLQALCEGIAHPARRQILLTIHLRGGEVTAGAIAGRFAHAWPTTTRHLRVLEGAGLLMQRQAGRERLYKLAPGAFDPLVEWLGWFGVSSLYGGLGDPQNAPGHGTRDTTDKDGDRGDRAAAGDRTPPAPRRRRRAPP
jgi:DNA-binding transcriptional ArsR family regulator